MFYYHMDYCCSWFQHLRQVGVVGKFVEFYGPGVQQLSLADRATISNMCPEYGATIGFFPVDTTTIGYLRQSSEYEWINRTLVFIIYIILLFISSVYVWINRTLVLPIHKQMSNDNVFDHPSRPR